MSCIVLSRSLWGTLDPTRFSANSYPLLSETAKGGKKGTFEVTLVPIQLPVLDIQGQEIRGVIVDDDLNTNSRGQEQDDEADERKSGVSVATDTRVWEEREDASLHHEPLTLIPVRVRP